MTFIILQDTAKQLKVSYKKTREWDWELDSATYGFVGPALKVIEKRIAACYFAEL